MARRSISLVFFLGMFAACADAQWGAYFSTSRGYHTNPLFNYAEASDQIQQTNLEVKYRSSPALLTYTGGLTLFNTLSERTFYEHSLDGLYKISLSPTEKESTVAPDGQKAGREDEEESADSTDEAAPGGQDQEQTSEDEVLAKPDTGASLILRSKISARHDRTILDDYDNFGVEFLPEYRLPLSKSADLSLNANAGYRTYPNLKELSNVSAQLWLAGAENLSEKVITRLTLSGGVKHFVTTVYDTSRFESMRTYVEKPAGKGKPGAKIKTSSGKKILVSPESRTVSQINVGFRSSVRAGGGSIDGEAIYRYNFLSSARYLAQYVSSTYLTEDIYHDYFSYSGLELRLTAKYPLPWGMEVLLTGTMQQKKFGAPALALTGDETAPNRLDQRWGLELYLQKFIDLSDHAGLGIFLTGSTIRNQSNDEYNDFAAWTVSAGVSLGLF